MLVSFGLVKRSQSVVPLACKGVFLIDEQQRRVCGTSHSPSTERTFALRDEGTSAKGGGCLAMHMGARRQMKRPLPCKAVL